jgi:hypothetical protein
MNGFGDMIAGMAVLPALGDAAVRLIGRLLNHCSLEFIS